MHLQTLVRLTAPVVLVALAVGCGGGSGGGGGVPAAPPTVSGVQPVTGPTAGGTLVTITGQGFEAGSVSVSIGGEAAGGVFVVDDTILTCVTPPGSFGPPVDVEVTTAGGTGALADAYVYLDEEPSWTGTLRFVLVGVPLAVDTDMDGAVDTAAQPGVMNVAAGAVPAGASLRAAVLFWGGSVAQVGNPLDAPPDATVTYTPPSGVPRVVVADDTAGDDGGAASYDVWLCRADVTAELMFDGGPLAGAHSVTDYDGLFADGASHSASAALLLVIEDPAAPEAWVGYDHQMRTMLNGAHAVTFDGFTAGGTPAAEIGWYTMEGDPGTANTEGVSATGMPGMNGLALVDALNPPTDPMNATVNTATPPLTGALGLDVDVFDATAAFAAGDTALVVDYVAGVDKWWLGVTVLRVTTAP